MFNFNYTDDTLIAKEFFLLVVIVHSDHISNKYWNGTDKYLTGKWLIRKLFGNRRRIISFGNHTLICTFTLDEALLICVKNEINSNIFGHHYRGLIGSFWAISYGMVCCKILR